MNNMNINPIINFDVTNDITILNPTGITLQSISKWEYAKSDNIILNDYGLTMFDYGVSNNLVNSKTFTPSDNFLYLNQIGYNTPINPTSGETSGYTISTTKLNAGVVGSGENKYINLDGGYFTGFFKLQGYNYEVMPARNNGITFDTVVYITENTSGIFLMLGGRSEDKYCPYYCGEFDEEKNSTIFTSNDGELNAVIEEDVHKKSFKLPEESTEIVKVAYDSIEDLKNNVFSFEITDDKKIRLQYINQAGNLAVRESMNIITASGFTIISIVSIPEFMLSEDEMECHEDRNSNVKIYINGRIFHEFENVPEFFFKEYHNDYDKLIGIPYTITWGGGSFGLKNSWHFDTQTYSLYTGQDDNFINTHYSVTEFNIDSNDFKLKLNNIEYEFNVMELAYTGGTGNTYLVYYNKPISVLPYRVYKINADIYDTGIFEGNIGNVSLVPIADNIEFDIKTETKYNSTVTHTNSNIFPDEHIYVKNGVMYYGETGNPVSSIFNELTYENNYITGVNVWTNISTTFMIKGVNERQFINIGFLIESPVKLKQNSLYIKDFTYEAQDIIVKDVNKNNLMIEQNFNKPFYGGIQKLRVYDSALSSNDILTIASNETNMSVNITKGGRLIYR